MGTVSNIALNTADLTAAAVINAVRQAVRPGAGRTTEIDYTFDPARVQEIERDAVTFRELSYRAYGMWQALADWQTYHNTIESYKQGHAVNAPDRLELNEQAVLPGSMVTEYPRRGLAAIDAFFRSFIEQAEFYGMAVRQARKEGRTGSDFEGRVQQLAKNPTDEMRAMATREADIQQLLSNSGPVVRMLNVGKARYPGMDGASRLLRFGIQNVLPFVRNMENIATQLVRHTPVFQLLVGDVRDDWMAGGARRDTVVAKMLVGSTVMSIASYLAMDDKLTGNRPADYKRAEQDTSGGIPPRSFQLPDGTWRSYDGLDALALPFATVADFVDKYKRGELTEGDKAEIAKSIIRDGIKAVSEAGFMNNLGTFTEAMTSDQDSKFDNYVAGVTSSFVPVFLRQYTQWYDDPAGRVTTGDNSFGDRVVGRVKSAIPGLSDDLPQKVDVYGRPVFRESGPVSTATTLGRSVPKETDPVVLEVNRLARTESKALVPPISKRADDRTLAAEEYVMLQTLAGQFIRADLKEAIQDPVWKELTDEEKREEIRLIVKEAHADAREELFGGDEDETDQSQEEEMM